MNCNCSLTNGILAVIAIVFSLWQTTYSKWIVVVVATLIFIHSLVHKHTNKGK